jgi:multiple sugar transport system substrate-binding protein
MWEQKKLTRLSACAMLTAVLLLLLSACGSSANTSSTSGSVVNLTFWSWVPNLQTSIDLFNKTHPNIHVTWDSVTSGSNGTYAKMFTAIKAGNAPDLGQVEYQFLPTFEATGGLEDLAPYGAASVQNDFVPWTWSQVTQGSSIYAIPQDTGPMAMFYRADLFSKYHLPVPTTWAQYASDAQQLHAADPSAYITDFPPKESGQFIGLAWQAGAQWFGTSGQSWKVNINDAASEEVANYWQSLLNQHLVNTDPDFAQGWYNDLANGTDATWISAVWGANTIISNAPKTSGDWKVAPMPQWTAGQSAAGNWGGSTTVVFKDTKYPQQAAEFAEWLNTNQQSVQDMVDGAQLYPALQAALNTPASSSAMAFYGGQDINQVFRAASLNVNDKFQWGPTMNDVFTNLGDLFSNAVNGQTTLGAALNSVQTSTIQDMQKQGFSVSQ